MRGVRGRQSRALFRLPQEGAHEGVNFPLAQAWPCICHLWQPKLPSYDGVLVCKGRTSSYPRHHEVRPWKLEGSLRVVRENQKAPRVWGSLLHLLLQVAWRFSAKRRWLRYYSTLLSFNSFSDNSQKYVLGIRSLCCLANWWAKVNFQWKQTKGVPSEEGEGVSGRGQRVQ